jgi:predicted Fe-Mo cluster-binding NifX family protein
MTTNAAAQPGEPPGKPSMIVGVTSQNFRSITGHAGKCRRFLVYAVSDDGHWQAQDRLDLPKEMSLHAYPGDDHPAYALDVIITAGCGERFIQRMQEHGVAVLTTAETDPISALQRVIRKQPLPPAVVHEHDHR